MKIFFLLSLNMLYKFFKDIKRAIFWIRLSFFYPPFAWYYLKNKGLLYCFRQGLLLCFNTRLLIARIPAR